MKVEQVEIDKIIPYVNNAKIHTDEQIDLIAGSIKEFGFLNPIILSEDNEIIAGHGRFMAAKKLGLKVVPVIRAEDLTPAQIKAYRLADNRLAELAEWDTELLKVEIEGLEDLDFDLSLIGFDDVEITALFDDGGYDEDREYTTKAEPIVYEPQREEPPEINTLIDENKTSSLISKIEASNITDKELKEFLKKAATRFLRFDYQEIAEYYAHAEPEAQAIMEDLALVIVDVDKAIQNGFLHAESYLKEVREKELKQLEAEE